MDETRRDERGWRGSELAYVDRIGIASFRELKITYRYE